MDACCARNPVFNTTGRSRSIQRFSMSNHDQTTLYGNVKRQTIQSRDAFWEKKASCGPGLGWHANQPTRPDDASRRETMLPRLIPVSPREVADLSIPGRRYIVMRLAKALRGERMRGRAGHWTYSLNRHIGLLRAYRSEREALKQLKTMQLATKHLPPRLV